MHQVSDWLTPVISDPTMKELSIMLLAMGYAIPDRGRSSLVLSIVWMDE